jgi:hypothetical protein
VTGADAKTQLVVANETSVTPVLLPSAAGQAPPEDYSFSSLLVRPYNVHIAALAHFTERSALAAALAPHVLATHIRDGATLALDRYGANLAPVRAVDFGARQAPAIGDSIRAPLRAAPRRRKGLGNSRRWDRWPSRRWFDRT